MAATIPFTQETFRPLCIKQNDVTETPVEFEISAVGGANRARLKSIMVASEGLEMLSKWTPEIQASVIAAFATGSGVFVDGVDAIRNLYVPAILAKRLGLIPELPNVKDGDPIPDWPITTGSAFAIVCGHWPILSLEVALAIARLSGQAEIDPRFFVWLSTSLGTPGSPRGIAESAQPKSRRNGTAGFRTPRARNGKHT